MRRINLPFAVLLYVITQYIPAFSAEESNNYSGQSDDRTQNVECVGSFGESLDEENNPCVLSGHTLFLAQDFTLRSLDLSSPAHPREIGWLRLAGIIHSLALRGHALYVGTEADVNALKIIDVSDPANLRLRAVLPQETVTGVTVHVMGRFLLTRVTKGYAEYSVFNLENPFAPVKIDGGDLRRYWNAFLTDGTHYFKTDRSSRNPAVDDGKIKIALFDITDTETTVSTHLFPYEDTEEVDRTFHTWLLESVDRYTSGTISIGNPNGPAKIWIFSSGLSDFENNTRKSGLASADNHLEFNYTKAGLNILEITDPTRPVKIGSYPSLPPLTSVKLAAAKAYAVDFTGGLYSLDFSNPTHPVLLASYKVPHPISSFAIEDDLAFVGSEKEYHSAPHDLQLLDLTRPMSTSLLSCTSLPYPIYSMASGPKRLYLAAGDAGLQIMDTSNPTSLTHIGSYSAKLPCLDLATSGTLIYAVSSASVTDEIDVIDTTTKGPTLRGSALIQFAPDEEDSNADKLVLKKLGNFVFGIRVMDYATGTGASFYVIDISNPDAPKLVYRTKKGGEVEKISSPPKSGPYPGWYLALPTSFHNTGRSGAGLLIYDVSDPRRPVLVGCYDRMHAVDHVSLCKNLIIAADDRGGLVILRPSPPLPAK